MPPWGCQHAFAIAKDSVFATGAMFLTAYPHLTDESLVAYASPELSRLLIPAGMTARASNETIKALQNSKYLETRLNLEGVRSVMKGVVDAGLLNDPVHDIQALFTQIHLWHCVFVYKSIFWLRDCCATDIVFGLSLGDWWVGARIT